DDAQRVSIFSAGIVVGAKQPETARALVKFLESPAVIPVLRKAGLEPAREVPTFKVDASWPKIPNNWQFGQVSSVAIDAQDHVWILQRPGTLSAAEKPRAAPPVLEFNADGTFIQAWGGPGPQYEWPESEHGIHVDPKDFVWIGGNGSKDHQ